MTICMYSDQIHAYKKSLNIPKGQQKAVHQSTDNSMAKKTPTNNDIESTTQKTKDWATGTPQPN